MQPKSETNASSWAMYSSSQVSWRGLRVASPARGHPWPTSQGADNVAATPLANPDPASIYDVSDLTPPLTAGGQADTRYTLGLNVTRYYEQAPGGPAAGFRLRFAVTNTNASSVRIGSLGIPLLSNTNFGGLNLSQVAAFGSFLDGWPGGGQHSFATMARADGSDMAVVSVLHRRHPHCARTPRLAAAPQAYSCEPQPGLPPTGMEAYRPVLEDAGDTAGGVYAWEAVSGAFAPEWAANKQFPAVMDFPSDQYHEGACVPPAPLHLALLLPFMHPSPVAAAAWPNPRSPTPSWHLAETFLSPAGSPPRQWNPPTTITLAPGETRQFAVCFTLATPANQGGAAASKPRSLPDRRAAVAAALMGSAAPGTPTGRGPRVRDATLARVGAPVLFPIPGYVIGTDMANASLAVLPPAGAAVAGASCDDPTVLAIVGFAPAHPGGPGAEVNLTSVSLQGLARGPARVVVNFTDGTWLVSEGQTGGCCL